MQKSFVGTNCLTTENGEKTDLKYYVISEGKLFDDFKDSIITYGIEIVKDDTESERIRDVSINQSEINRIINILMDNKVTPTHLCDVIENFL